MSANQENSDKLNKKEDSDYEKDDYLDSKLPEIDIYQNSQNCSFDSYEKQLDKEIEANCDFGTYVDKLEVEEKPDSELLKLDKHEIIEFKNYQIKKYKAYIASLEREKMDLIENFKDTTNVLLERIKEYEEKDIGERPQTAFIMKQIHEKQDHQKKPTQQYTPSFLSSNSKQTVVNYTKGKDDGITIADTANSTTNEMYLEKSKSVKSDEKLERCVKCKNHFNKAEYALHSLQCLRKPMIICKACKEYIDEKEKESHLQEYRSKEKVIFAINEAKDMLLDSCFEHGFQYNTILDKLTGNSIIHLICEKGDDRLLNCYLVRNYPLNLINQKMETPLVSYLI